MPHHLTIILTTSGALDTFDAPTFRNRLATFLSVPPSTVTLTLSGGSVRVHAVVSFAVDGATERAAALVRDATEEALSEALGVTVEVIHQVTSSTTPAPPNPPPSLEQASTLALEQAQTDTVLLGLVVAILVINVCAIASVGAWCWFCVAPWAGAGAHRGKQLRSRTHPQVAPRRPSSSVPSPVHTRVGNEDAASEGDPTPTDGTAPLATKRSRDGTRSGLNRSGAGAKKSQRGGEAQGIATPTTASGRVQEAERRDEQ